MTSAVAPHLDRLLRRLDAVVQRGNGWMACCPAHDDAVPSLSVGLGDDDRVLLHCFAGCPAERIVAAIGLELRDLFPADAHRGNGRVPPPPRRRPQPSDKPEPTFASPEAFAASELRNVKSRFDYHDANGELVYVVFRIEPPGEKKLFLPAHRQADGRWIGTHMPAPRVLYRLPQLLAAKPDDMVLVLEGEGCVETAVVLGWTATTSSAGSKAADKTDWSPMKGKVLVVLPDADDAGAGYANDVVRLARAAGAASVRVLRLPGLEPGSGEDLVDWVARFEDRDAAGEELSLLIEANMGDSSAETGSGEPSSDAKKKRQDSARTPPMSPLDVVRRWRKEGPVQHEPTDFPTLDKMTRGGLVLGTTAVLIGSPDAAKTLFVTVLLDRYHSRGLVVGLLAVDEDEDGITTRLLQRRNVSREDCEVRDAKGLDAMELSLAGTDLIRIYDATWSIDAAAADVAAFAAECGKRAVFGIDSLQTVTCDAEVYAKSIREQVSLRMLAMKRAARMHRMLVLSTSEMARRGYDRADAEDEVNDLATGKESGSIEYQAKVLMSVRAGADPDRPDLIKLRVVKNKIGTIHDPKDKNAGIRLRINPQFQTLIEDEDYKAPKVDETCRDQVKLARDKKELTILAAGVAVVMAQQPGLSLRGLRGAARAHLTQISNDRVDACLALLGPAVVRVEGLRNTEHHYLNGTAVPEEIMRHVQKDRPTVEAARPPETWHRRE